MKSKNDPLGYVRVTFTTEPDVWTYEATMEPGANQAVEELYFQYVDSPSTGASLPAWGISDCETCAF
ncbi:MAG: hypothetical protein RJQ09_16850 [Cyclobacteriaceae bacterium]